MKKVNYPKGLPEDLRPVPELWNKMSKEEQNTFTRLAKSVKSELKNIPNGKDRDSVIAHNIAYLISTSSKE